MTQTFIAGLAHDRILGPMPLPCPIEQVFAKIKALLRRMTPRSFAAICDAPNSILDAFSPAECANYLRHSG